MKGRKKGDDGDESDGNGAITGNDNLGVLGVPDSCLYHAPNKHFLQAELSHQRQRAIWNGVSATPLGH